LEWEVELLHFHCSIFAFFFHNVSSSIPMLFITFRTFFLLMEWESVGPIGAAEKNFPI
jgi:hypothetical protein